ncbi:MAG: S41 family peptidase [Clostridia bacterium]|nr:S41 family peptidase [Clostridia bacterium]
MRSRNNGKRALMLFMIPLLLTSCALLPFTVGDSVLGLLEGESEMVTIPRAEYERLSQYAELDELLQWVEYEYYEEPDVDAMLENAMAGLLYGLEDPYTFYYTPEAFAAMWEDDKGEYAGVGIQLTGSYDTNICSISRVFSGTPAEAAGLHKGDVLVLVEDLEVNIYNMQEAVDIMRGVVGQKVTLQVRRGNELLDFEILRDFIHVNRVSSLMLDQNIGYIALYEFASGSDAEFQAQLDELLDKGAVGLIVDLRDNPGGWVEGAQNIADIFLPECIIAYQERRDGSREYYNATAGELNIPLVLLINENSASAAEILAGALQDHQKASLVGTKTFGKGIVQHVVNVGTQGGGMQLTIAQYFTPDGHTVHKVGILPDVEVSLPEGSTMIQYELGDVNDIQLAKAIEVVRSLGEE